MSIRIEKLSFRAANKTGADPLEFNPGTVTILVGPNNSGKSQALRDIEALCTGTIGEATVIKNVELTYPETVEEKKKLLKPFEIETAPINHKVFRKPSLIKEKQQIQRQLHETQVENSLQNLEFFKNNVVPFYLERLDGRARFSLVEERSINDLKELSVIDYLSALFTKDEIRKKIRKITKEAFNLYFVVDRTGSKLCIRMSRKEPPSDKIERGADNESIEFHRNADLITELGDGIQAFVGLIAGLFSLQDTIILIDEPEAFLADPIARRLGSELTKIAQERKASLIVSTHSSDFVMGCVENSNDPRIVRLTYQDQKSTAREAKAEVIREFITNPCLRSSAAIRGLFHKGVIVTEGHRDRVFYDEVNRRLLETRQDKGMDDVLFIDSGGGLNMIYKTLAPLRKMGVPAVAIVDIDFLTKPDKEWKNLTDACQIEIQKESIYTKNRDSIIQEFKIKLKIEDSSNLTEEEKNKAAEKLGEKIKKKGIKNFSSSSESYNTVKSFIESLAAYGLFIVPIGELESWIPELPKKPTTTRSWDKEVFEKMGHPDKDDFNSWWGLDKWSFVHKISKWINDPDRKGVA